MEYRKLPDHPFLLVSERGDIKNTTTGTTYAQSQDKDGYWRVRSSFGGKFFDYRTHRAVAIVFLDKPTDPSHTIVNHKDGNNQNNHFSNLEWCSVKYNTLHALHVTRSTKPHNSVSDEKVLEVVKLLTTTDLTYVEIASKLDVSKKTVANIAIGESYTHITKGVRLVKRGSKRLSVGTVEWVCRKLQEGLSVNDVVSLSNNKRINYMIVYKIYKRISNKVISSKYVW